MAGIVNDKVVYTPFEQAVKMHATMSRSSADIVEDSKTNAVKVRKKRLNFRRN